MRSLLIGLLLAATQPAVALDRFVMTFDDDLDGVEVEACFDGRVPDTLYRHEAAGEHTEEILREFGFSDEEVAARLASGAVVAQSTD